MKSSIFLSEDESVIKITIKKNGRAVSKAVALALVKKEHPKLLLLGDLIYTEGSHSSIVIITKHKA